MANHDQGHDKPKQAPQATPKEFDPDAVVEDMNSFYKAYSYSKRAKVAYPVFVTEDVFDILTDGDTKAPLFWKGEGTAHGNSVPIIPFPRKQQGLDIFSCKAQVHIPIVGMEPAVVSKPS